MNTVTTRRANNLETYYEREATGEVILVYSGIGNDNSSIHLGKYDEYGDFVSTEELFSVFVNWAEDVEIEKSYTPGAFHLKVLEFMLKYGF